MRQVLAGAWNLEPPSRPSARARLLPGTVLLTHTCLVGTSQQPCQTLGHLVAPTFCQSYVDKAAWARALCQHVAPTAIQSASCACLKNFQPTWRPCCACLLFLPVVAMTKPVQLARIRRSTSKHASYGIDVYCRMRRVPDALIRFDPHATHAQSDSQLCSLQYAEAGLFQKQEIPVNITWMLHSMWPTCQASRLKAMWSVSRYI